MKVFRIDPQRKNYCLCLRVKSAESSDRTKEYDEIYVGYLDGSIVLNKIWPNSAIEVQEVWKGELKFLKIYLILGRRESNF